MQEITLYKGNYKYQLYKERIFQLGFEPGESIFDNVPFSQIYFSKAHGRYVDCCGFIHLWANGRLVLLRGYGWDGVTWFPDLAKLIIPSLVHDALYQLIRNGILSLDPFREEADKQLNQMCRDRKMMAWLAGSIYYVVRMLGEPSATVGRPVLEAV